MMASDAGRRALAAIVAAPRGRVHVERRIGERATDPDAAAARWDLRVGVPNNAPFGRRPGSGDVFPQTWELVTVLLFATLYSYNGKPAEEGGAEVRPDLAEGMPEVSSDGLTWTFRLKQGLRYAPPFEDTPIVALDIVRGLERQARAGMHLPPATTTATLTRRSVGSTTTRKKADSIVGLETPDDRTLVVRLTEITGDLRVPLLAAGDRSDPGRSFRRSRRRRLRAVPRRLGAVHGRGVRGPRLLRPTRAAGAGERLRPRHAQRRRSGSRSRARSCSFGTRPGIRRRTGCGPRIPTGSRWRSEAATTCSSPNAWTPPRSTSSSMARARRSSRSRGTGRTRHWKTGCTSTRGTTGWPLTMNLAMPPFDDVHVRRAVNLAIDEGGARRSPLEGTERTGGNGGREQERTSHPMRSRGCSCARSIRTPTIPRPLARRCAHPATTGRATACATPACRNVRALVCRTSGLIPSRRRCAADLAEIGIELELEVLEGIRSSTCHGPPRTRIPMGIAWPWGKDYPEGTGWFLGLFDVGARPRNVRGKSRYRGRTRRWSGRVEQLHWGTRSGPERRRSPSTRVRNAEALHGLSAGPSTTST